jgi:YD repeat-containing protein
MPPPPRLWHLIGISLLLVMMVLPMGETKASGDFELTTWAMPGEGATPTFLQYLDIQGYNIKAAQNLASANERGDVVVSYDIELPPALLKPTLSLSYVSGAGVDLEAPYGWGLNGIAEIRRPLEPAYEDDEWLISGTGFSGVLKSSGTNQYVLRTSTPTLVSAKYDTAENSWELHADNTTMTFEEQDDGAGTASGTALWRVTKTTDTAGNYIAYRYHDDGRIKSIAYGGNSETDERHLVRVEFTYGDNTHRRTSARAGFLTTYQYRLSQITIKSRAGSSSAAEISGLVDSIASAATPSSGQGMVAGKVGQGGASPSADDSDDDSGMVTRYSYVLDCTETDGVDLLTTLKREDTTTTSSEVIAEFEYDRYKISDSPGDTTEFETPTIPGEMYAQNTIYWELDDCAQARQYGYVCLTALPDGSVLSNDGWLNEWRPSYSGTVRDLVDVNGDGLPDRVDAEIALQDHQTDDTSDTPWYWKTQKVDFDDRTFSWSDDHDISTPEKFQYQWYEVEAPESVDDYFTGSKTNQTHMNIDVDGDGLLDQIVTHGRVADGTETEWWVIYYGTGHGFDAATSVYGPGSSKDNPNYDFLYPASSQNIVPNSISDSETTAVDLKRTLMDMNGDGWVDAYDPSNGIIYYHTGTRSGGWGDKTELTSYAGGIRKIRYTIENISEQYSSKYSGDTCDGDFKASDCPLSVGDEVAYSLHCDDMCEAGCVLDLYNCMVDCEDDTHSARCMKSCRKTNDGISPCADACKDSYCAETKKISYDDGSTKVIEQHYVAYTDETQGFYDMNGDGLPDLVRADLDEWRVYLNNGTGFESVTTWNAQALYLKRTDEGFPTYEDIGEEGDVDGDGLNNVIESTASKLFGDGESSRVFQTLIDVDGDGLLDLAFGDHEKLDEDIRNRWYKNTGARFENTTRPLPAWWPDSFYSAYTTIPIDNDQAPDDDDWKQESDTRTTALMTDFNHDGLVDYVTAERVKYTPYHKLGLLTKVKNGQGGKTGISYRSLATVTPSGKWTEDQHTPIVKDLLDHSTTEDSLTGQNAQTSYAYEDGYYEKGVFQGFRARKMTHLINGGWTDHVNYTYELDRDLPPLVTLETIYTDFNLNFSLNLSRGDENSGLRYQVENTYDDHSRFSDFTQFHLIQTKKITEYGEGGGSGKSVTLSYNWDEDANLKQYSHDGGGNSSDELDVDMAYTSDSDKRFFRLATKSVSGTDPLTGSVRAFEYTRYYYDDNTNPTDTFTKGFLSKTQVSGGWVGGGGTLDDDILEIVYTHGDRGELTKATDKSTGISISQTFGFGGTVVETQTNDLGQKITREIDEQGRVTKISDSNNLSLITTYDDFGRVTKTQVTDADNTTYTREDMTHTYSGSPYYTKIQSYDDNGNIEGTGYVLQDGFGRDAQTWEQDASGNFLVSNVISDLRGLPIATTHPQSSTTFGRKLVDMTASANVFNVTAYDAFGIPRAGVRDKSAKLKSFAVYLDSPWEQVSQDENDYRTKLSHDALHRVTKVEQGMVASDFTTTAKYKYDPLGRVVQFKDANGVYYDYSYDGAGRLRQVSYGSGAALNSSSTSKTPEVAKTSATPSTTLSLTPTTWYSYEYTGLLKTKMTDATGAYASWEHDAIGRPSKMVMSDSLPSSTGTLTYTYAYDTAWKGALDSVTDPTGTTTYSYDKFGRVSKAGRSYTGGTSATTPTIAYATDLHGREIKRTLPSGRVIKSKYAYGHLTQQSGATLGTTEYTLDYAYNKWELLETATASSGHTFTNTFTTPLWTDEIKVAYGSDSTAYAYKWQDNGLLSSRTVKTGSGSTTSSSSSSSSSKKPSAKTSIGGTLALSTYSYDNLRELTKIESLSKTIESYAYDSAGNPTNMVDSSGLTWTYGAAGKLNQITSRTSNKGATESYTYDQAGRVATITTSSGTKTHYYDGMGRLRGVDKDGTMQMVIDYDVEGNMARKASGNPFTSTPDYIYVFHDWRYDTKNAKYTENDNAFVATQNGTRTWLFKDYDGHVAKTFNDKGASQSSRTLGAFGATVSSSGTPWELNSFHSVELQNDDLFHMGQRHLMQKDGTWLQPEPLLYLGLPQDKLSDPLGIATRRYARNTPNVYHDLTGYANGILMAGYLKNPDNPIVGSLAVMQEELSPDNLLMMIAGEGIARGVVSAVSKGVVAYKLSKDLAAIQHINPTGGNYNCIRCAEATAKTLSGTPAVAARDFPNVKSADHFAAVFKGAKYGPPGTIDEITAAAKASGNDAVGIVRGVSGSTWNHVFNVANRGGIITFLDGQSGRKAVTAGFKEFQLMITQAGRAPISLDGVGMGGAGAVTTTGTAQNPP